MDFSKEVNYTGTRTEKISTDLISVSDKKKVTIRFADGASRFYYTGDQIAPEIIVTDINGKDISDCVTVAYGKNTGVGIGTVSINGVPEKGYYGVSTLKFTILPKWAKWIFK